MNLNRLIVREIAYRKTGFLLGVLAVAVAVTCFAGGLTFLRAHAERSQAAELSMRQEAEADLKKLEDGIRKSMKGLGFNIHIYPEDQNLSEVYEQGFASKTMPEAWISKLANSKIVTVNHLLSSLTQKVDWPEQNRTVVLVGTGGEVPIAFRDAKKPLQPPVEPGTVVLGYELHRGLEIDTGDPIKFRGKTYTAARLHTQRGSVDDITMWLPLKEVQAMMGKPGLINSIVALECNCESIDRIGDVRAEISAILPDTAIIETESTALARAEARNKAKDLSRSRLAALKASHVEMEEEREDTLSWLLPLVGIACAIWIAVLALHNVRHRMAEIGALRALGLRTSGLMYLLLGRALLAGLLGAVLAWGALWLLGSIGNFSVPGAQELILIFLLAPILASLATWLPALFAARRDPASILHHA